MSPAPQPQKSALLQCSVASPRCGPKPLLVIDGRLESWDGSPDLNPSEIESVEVVKGQAALRLYGADAKHGVVRITTKKVLKY
jgi:TonB-dependent SusC/RagA subfamily outer membrane receptor